jgi:hypothetical protein
VVAHYQGSEHQGRVISCTQSAYPPNSEVHSGADVTRRSRHFRLVQILLQKPPKRDLFFARCEFRVIAIVRSDGFRAIGLTY